MIMDVALQVGLLVLMGVLFLFMHDIPRKALNHVMAFRNRSKTEAKRHFVLGAQLYARAKSPSTSKSASKSLARQAEAEADKAISLDPTDAASHILKALSLDLLGFTPSALSSLDVALSPLAAPSLSPSERADALLKRADLLLSSKAHAGPGALDSAISDLQSAVGLSPSNAAAFCLLGDCYEQKKMKDDARSAYEAALKVQPDLAKAKDALLRLD